MTESPPWLSSGSLADPHPAAATQVQSFHAPGSRVDPAPPTPLLVFDGGCVFCSHFAALSELHSGIPGLLIRDGRADHELRQQLSQRGFRLRDGAVLVVGDQVLHGAAAIQWLCERMAPSLTLLHLLTRLLATPPRARRLYPVLLLARRLALGVRGLPVDPDLAVT